MSIGRLNRLRLLGTAYSSTLANWGRRGIIKSVQRATITLNNVTSNTATITAVDPNNAVLYYLGQRGGSTSVDLRTFPMRVELTNSTTVTATVNFANASNHVISFEVIEYFPGVIKSLQRGTFTGTATSFTTTITAVDTTRATLVAGGWSTASTAGLEADTLQGHLDLQNSTTVRFQFDNTAGFTFTVPYQVVEFY